MGTGVLGRLLAEEDFANIDGADASPCFVNAAANSGYYRETSEMFFGRGVDKLPQHLLGKYDIVTSVGCFLEGHIPASCFDEAHALCKPGGHFVTSLRSEYYANGQKEGYKDKLDQMVAAGKFKLLKVWTFKRGIPDATDKMFAEMSSTMFLCQRIDE